MTNGWLETWLTRATPLDFMLLATEISDEVKQAARALDYRRLADLLVAIDSCLREGQRRASALW